LLISTKKVSLQARNIDYLYHLTTTPRRRSMRAGRILSVIGIAVMLLMLASEVVMAGAKVVEFEDMTFDASTTISDNLKMLEGKVVYVTVSSGKRIGGTVKDIGNNLLHLQKLTDEDFHDALIRIDQIILIDTKVRGYRK